MSSTQSLSAKQYEKELLRLQTELVFMQEWIVASGRRLVVLFEGRDTAGKGGVIKRITSYLNPRTCRIVAVPTPTERERSQWYFQRYVAHLPAAGEIVLFDRSWYNRAGRRARDGLLHAGRVRGVPALLPAVRADAAERRDHPRQVLAVGQRRGAGAALEKRLSDPRKRWKFSPTDLQARARWVDYAEAKDRMFARTDTELSPWYVVEADDKRTARLNLISHLLSLVPYERPEKAKRVKLPGAPAAQVRAPAQADRAPRPRALRRRVSAGYR